MNEQNSKNGQLVFTPESLTWDLIENYAPTTERIVCVSPVRTIVRREEEIVLIRKVRKVEEVDASPACPINTVQVGGYQQDSQGEEKKSEIAL